jgi:hypothetical protein
MTFFNSGSVLDIISVIGISGLCIGTVCFLYRVLYELFCFNITENNSIDSNNNNENDNVIISITNITPFNSVSCVNIPDDTIIDNEKNLPVATIV